MEVVEIIKEFLLNNIAYWYYVIFFLIIIVNIFPVAFFVYPQIILILAVFLVENSPIWYSMIIVLIIWSLIWESISYFLWKILWKKILNKRKEQKKYIKKIIVSIKKNPIKTIFVWKFTPIIFTFIPLVSGITKINFFKFLLVNSIATTLSILYISFIVLIWLKSINFILFQENYLLIILSLILIMLVLFYIVKKKKSWKSFD